MTSYPLVPPCAIGAGEGSWGLVTGLRVSERFFGGNRLIGIFRRTARRGTQAVVVLRFPLRPFLGERCLAIFWKLGGPGLLPTGPGMDHPGPDRPRSFGGIVVPSFQAFWLPPVPSQVWDLHFL